MIRIVSDGTVHGAKVLDSIGEPIPGVSEVALLLKAGEVPMARLTFVSPAVDILAKAVLTYETTEMSAAYYNSRVVAIDVLEEVIAECDEFMASDNVEILRALLTKKFDAPA